MEKESKSEKRRSVRFPTNLKAFYSLGKREEEMRACTVINISLNGAGLEFYTPEDIGGNSTLSLTITAPGGGTAIHTAGVVRWVKRGRRDFLCGVKLNEALDDDTLAALGLT